MTLTHMAREVAEIPEVARQFISADGPVLSDLGATLRSLDPLLIVTVARGSSDHAATYLKYAVELTAGVPVASVGPSVASVYNRSLRLDRAACIGISQSGASPDIVAMMQSARASGALSVAITNSPDSPVADAADYCLPLQAGVESSVAATKTFVVSVLAGLALVAAWQDDARLGSAIAALPEAFAAALDQDWTPLSDRMERAQSTYVLGRGPGFAVAAEMALKLKEICGLHAESHSAAEVLHGPSAIVRKRFPVLALAIEDAARGQVIATAEHLASQGAGVFITACDAAGARSLPAPAALHPLVDPLVRVVSFYAMVEKLSRRRGFDPDMPFRLQKVTSTT